MWWYAANVLRPVQLLKQIGIPIFNQCIGEKPVNPPKPGLGRFFSKRHSFPVFLDRATAHDHLVEEFDKMSESYSHLVDPFSQPIFDEALKVMYPYLLPDSRVLDAGCGPGKELQRVAQLVPNGEVVGIDLAAGMVKSAYDAALHKGLNNCAFYQADVTNLPKEFEGRFDLVYNCLAHHHYPDPPKATKSILECLRPGGIYCVVDPGPAWYNALSAPIAKKADPGWISFHTPEQFRELFHEAGFARSAWVEILPGFGVALGQKESDDKTESNARPEDSREKGTSNIRRHR